MFVPGPGQAQGRGTVSAPSTREFEDYINQRPRFRQQHTWGIFLGTGWHQDSLHQIETWRRRKKWLNPFTGRPLDKVKVFVFGHANPVLEGGRIVSDHLEVHVLSSWDELRDQHFDFAICHSNGCTNAIGAHRAGVMGVDHFLALGTDWTTKYFRPGELRGADLTFFAMQGDPIWKLPAPNWARITEATPGLAFTVPFGRGQPRYPVIRLEPPSGRHGTLTRPFQAHALVDTYFQSLGNWMRRDGAPQRALSESLRAAGVALQEERRDVAPTQAGTGGPSSAGCPPYCGGGGGPGPGPQGPGPGALRSTPGLDPRGGISIDIHLHPDDFQAR